MRLFVSLAISYSYSAIERLTLKSALPAPKIKYSKLALSTLLGPFRYFEIYRFYVTAADLERATASQIFPRLDLFQQTSESAGKGKIN